MTENAFHRLKAKAIAESTRTYNARGKLVNRCDRCQIHPDHCICDLSPNIESEVDFVLIFHRDEIFKPSNSGRLIADAFPMNTFAFCWDRKSPDEELISLIKDPGRDCYIVFPADETYSREILQAPVEAPGKKLTLIMLDATWRQGRRMFNFSQWLAKLPVLRISPSEKADYASRKAHQEDYLSTAESAALALSSAGYSNLAKTLLDYFSVFNQRYMSMRSNHKPKQKKDNHQQSK